MQGEEKADWTVDIIWTLFFDQEASSEKIKALRISLRPYPLNNAWECIILVQRGRIYCVRVGRGLCGKMVAGGDFKEKQCSVLIATDS